MNAATLMIWPSTSTRERARERGGSSFGQNKNFPSFVRSSLLAKTNKQTNNSEIPMCAISYIYCGQKWPLEIYGAYPRPQKSLFSLLTWINPPPFANISTLQTLQLSILWFWNRKSECETLPLPMFQHCNCQCFIACKRCECESCKRPFLCCDLPNLRNKLKLKFNCENWGVPTSVTCPV